MKNLLLLSSVACLLILLDFLFINFPALPRQITGLFQPQAEESPAAKYCKSLGGVRIPKTDQSGHEFIFCRFPSGSVCEEWALYRKVCQRDEN